MKKRILSGITPSSTKGLHLGNFLGAVKPHIAFQDQGECFYFIANLHALNTVYDAEQVRANTENIFIEYLAFGLDPEKTTFYVEADIPAISVLQTILNNTVTIAELKRMHAYKDKLQEDVDPDTIGMGLFSYPVLMAADILAFNADIVPVGEDQTQHVEICREMARTFNNRYGDILKIPELSVQKGVARVPGIYGDRKMSKSLGNDIPVFGTEEEIKKQIMAIKTDPARIHPTDPGDPEKNITFTYMELMGYDVGNAYMRSLPDMKQQYHTGQIGDVTIKKTFLEYFLDYFAGARKKKQELRRNRDYIQKLRKKGAEKANQIAEETLEKVRQAVGVI